MARKKFEVKYAEAILSAFGRSSRQATLGNVANVLATLLLSVFNDENISERTEISALELEKVLGIDRMIVSDEGRHL